MNRVEWKRRLAERIDWSSKLTHLTKEGIVSGKKVIALDILLKILTEKTLKGSTTESGYICGDIPAVCFQDTPLYSLSQNIYYEQKLIKQGQKKIRYSGIGLLFEKQDIFRKGGRPVIYDKTSDLKEILGKDQQWRIVNYNLDNNDEIIDWTHEREWRIKHDYSFELKDVTVLLPNVEMQKAFLERYRNIFKSEAMCDLGGIINLGQILY